MIRRLLFALLSSLCLIFPIHANIIFNNTDAVGEVIKEYFPAEKDAASALATYNVAVKEGGVTGISSKSLWNVCTAGGLDIKKTTDKDKCRKFVNSLITKSLIRFYEVCGKDKGKTGGKEYCIDDFFTNKFFGGTQVNLTPGIQLAKEYARIKHSDDSLQCSKADPREIKVVLGATDYVLKCTSQKNNTFYEFVFDDLKESSDSKIQESIQNAICKMFDTPAINAGCAGGGTNVSGTMTCWNASCTTDSVATCSKINTSMEKFNYSAAYKNGTCEIDFKTILDKQGLKTAYGIDNFLLCRDIQVRNVPSLEDYLKQYIAEKANVNTYDVSCSNSFNTYRGGGCTSKIGNIKDDIITCRVGNNQIDFVVDDVNEFANWRHKGGISGVGCLTSDGSFDGKNCRLLGEENCKQLAESLKDSCPECDQPTWTNGTCLLPSAASADKINKAIKITTEVGAAAVGVALFFVPGAQGGAVVALNYVAGTLVISGAIGKTTANIVMQTGIFSEFADAAEQCKDEECAKKLINDCLVKINSYKKEFTDAEQKTVDDMFSHLFEQIPSDSDYWLYFMQNSDLFDPVTCEVKQTKQFWQHVRTISEIAEIAGALLRVGNLAFEKTQSVITKKIGEKVYAFGDNGKPGILLRSTVEGTAKTTGGAPFLNKLGLKYGTPYTWADAEQILSKVNLDVNLYRGATWYDKAKGLLRLRNGQFASALVRVPIEEATQITHITFNMAGMVNPALGTIAETAAGAAYFESKTAPGYKIPECLAQKEPYTGTIEIEDISVEPLPVKTNKTEKQVSQVPVPVVTPNTPVEPETIITSPVSTPVESVVISSNSVVSKTLPAVTPKSSSSDKSTTFTPDKTKNVGLIVGLTSAGLLVTGGIVGGVIAATSKSKQSEQVVTQATSDLEILMNKTFTPIGFVDGKQVSLISMPTTVPSYAKIVSVDNYAVVVVDYDGVNLPYYVYENKWTPLLGIGETGRWFNVYPKNNANTSGISKIDSITNLLNQQLTPTVVAKHAINNDTGLVFPTAAPEAFSIINAEFPNGVVQYSTMTPSDKSLYENNFYIIQQKLK